MQVLAAHLAPKGVEATCLGLHAGTFNMANILSRALNDLLKMRFGEGEMEKGSLWKFDGFGFDIYPRLLLWQLHSRLLQSIPKRLIFFGWVSDCPNSVRSGRELDREVARGSYHNAVTCCDMTQNPRPRKIKITTIITSKTDQPRV